MHGAAAGLVGDAASTGRASSAAIVTALAANELRLARRRGEGILVTFAIPAALLLFFGSVDVLPVPDADRIGWLLPGTIAIAVAASGLVALAITTAYERAYGVLKRLSGSPATVFEIALARVVALVAIEAVQTLLLVAIAALAFGWRPGPAANPVLLAAAVVAGTAAFGALGLVLARALRPETTLAVANGAFVVLLLVGGALVPLDRLPAGIAAVTGALPLAPLAELVGAGLGIPAANAQPDIARNLAVLAAWAVGGTLLALRQGRWD